MSAWWDLFLMGIGMFTGLVVVHFSLHALAEMNSGTNHGIRIAFILLACGGFVQMLDPFAIDSFGIHGDLILSGALATLFFFDRRCVACPRAAAMLIARKARRKTDRSNHDQGVTA